ncbi:polyprenyl synthetase family protein [Mycetocola tolaasinivorans]|uniref:Polyprenyl synthetase family protein n=1 Tax=Mycetocola tolaasinivorans TaxID=76635 RepID=A0A3L7AF72_9MICO|nr:polyprenyl synthetase family protein [Mycetocola tolaasinivorans]RLP78052.1 polyprenyl synthetase family protein [Mycetocola tolaasinivorans]
MNETEHLRDQLQLRIDQFLIEHETILARIAPDLATFSTYSQSFLRGGKRFRAIFAYWGWHGVRQTLPGVAQDDAKALHTILGVGAALEIFHAAALAHDDILDNSDTRRGEPAIHRRFEKLSADAGWRGDHAAFGVGSAILFGDMLLSWSDELMYTTLAGLPESAAAPARAEYQQMRTDVTAGQYLDVLEESAWFGHSDEELIERARTILTYKSAKYSVEVPLALGASTAGATPAQIEALREYGLAVGTAFQLRDDILGVFGDARVTGKPSGDDLREGKRTLLVALTRRELPEHERPAFDAQIGNPDLGEDEILALQKLMHDTGAVAETERIIAESVAAGRAALADSTLGADARAALDALAVHMSARSA